MSKSSLWASWDSPLSRQPLPQTLHQKRPHDGLRLGHFEQAEFTERFFTLSLAGMSDLISMDNELK
jgi:hypothetical protein